MGSRKNTAVGVFEWIDMTGGPDACWPWKGGTGGGNAKGKPRPYYNLDGRKWIAYRLVWMLVKGEELPSDVFLCHHCDNPICCNPAHLYKGTHQDNMNDMVNADRHGLSHATVRRIRWMLAQGTLTHTEIAELNETSKATVGRIARNELHTHPEDYPDGVDDMSTMH